MQKETFKNNIGFTQEEIAILLGITRSQWAMYESGKRDIPVEAKQKLIALLTATKKNKTSSKTVQKIITQEKKAMVQQLQKWTKEKQYLLMRVDQEIKTAEKIRQESFAALELISTLQEESSFKASPLLSIQNRAEKQLKKYSEQHLTHLQLKKETISDQLGIIAQKLQSYTNGAPTDLV